MEGGAKSCDYCPPNTNSDEYLLKVSLIIFPKKEDDMSHRLDSLPNTILLSLHGVTSLAVSRCIYSYGASDTSKPRSWHVWLPLKKYSMWWQTEGEAFSFLFTQWIRLPSLGWGQPLQSAGRRDGIGRRCDAGTTTRSPYHGESPSAWNLVWDDGMHIHQTA